MFERKYYVMSGREKGNAFLRETDRKEEKRDYEYLFL